MIIKTAKLSFITGKKFRKRATEKLRGFFANKFKNEDFFHNHDKKGKSIYRMPLIQYKIINGIPIVFGYNEASKIVAEKFLKVENLVIDKEEFKNFETSLSLNNYNLFIDDNLHSYRFETLWLPVNQKNYLSYINKKLDLNKVLQNHILTNIKGFGFRADNKIMVKGDFKEKLVKINNIEYFAFTGDFVANVKIPDYMSFGQMRAIGFGSVREGRGDR
jgi:hypothetical protein